MIDIVKLIEERRERLLREFVEYEESLILYIWGAGPCPYDWTAPFRPVADMPQICGPKGVHS